MDLTFSDEQELLASVAAGLVARAYDTRRVRELEAGEPGHDPATWATMTELGWTSLGLVELAIVAEQLGRGAVPSPLVATGALGAAIPALASRDGRIATLALLEPGMCDEWSPCTMRGGRVLDGTKLLVPWAVAAGVIVVTTRDGFVLVDASGDGVHTMRHDALGGEPLYAVEFDGAPAEPIDAGASLDGVLAHLAVASLAYAVGAAEAALTLSVQHAKDRHQFGRPIGSFQAVAHRCADMRADVDACRYLAYRAAWALDHDDDAALAVAAAKAYANDGLRRVAQHAHQVHGAIGFSTEHDLHLFTRRIKAFELSYGSTAHHHDRLATAMGLA